jgi:hypothetical protein
VFPARGTLRKIKGEAVAAGTRMARRRYRSNPLPDTE